MTSRPVRTVDLENPLTTNLTGQCELVLVRHGEQAYTSGMSWSDRVDPPLSKLGRQQAAALGEGMKSTRVDAVFCSPWKRAYDTGLAVAQHHGLQPTTIDELKEIDSWKLAPADKPLTKSFSKEEVTAVFRQAGRSHLLTDYTYSEDVKAFRARVAATLDGIIESHVGQRVVVACHSGVINVYLSRILKSQIDMLVKLHHSSITIVRGADERRAVISVNDFAHVLPFQQEINALNLS